MKCIQTLVRHGAGLLRSSSPAAVVSARTGAWRGSSSSSSSRHTVGSGGWRWSSTSTAADPSKDEGWVVDRGGDIWWLGKEDGAEKPRKNIHDAAGEARARYCLQCSWVVIVDVDNVVVQGSAADGLWDWLHENGHTESYNSMGAEEVKELGYARAESLAGVPRTALVEFGKHQAEAKPTASFFGKFVQALRSRGTKVMLASSHPVELLHGIALRNDLMRLQCMGPQLAYDGSGLATGEVVDKELDPQKEGYRTKLVRKVKATLRYEEWVVSALGCEAAGAEYRDTATGQLGASVYVGTTAYHSDPGIYEAADWVAPGFEVLEDALVEDAGSSSEEEHVDY